VIFPIVPAVVVLNEYEYDVLAAETWLLETVQLMFASVAARALETTRARMHEHVTTAPRASDVNRLRGRMRAGFAVRRFISFLSGSGGGALRRNSGNSGDIGDT
jgi:hypothetical protein